MTGYKMAVATAKKEAKPVDLKGQIEALRADLEAFLEARVAILKSSRDGAGLPTEMLRHQLLRGDDCWCRAVHRLLDESV